MVYHMIAHVIFVTWAYKPATDEKDETGKVIGLTGHDPPRETENGPATKNVSYDRHKKKTYLKLPRSGNRDSNREGTYQGKSRSGNRDGGEPGRELRREWKIHWAQRPNGWLENKNENFRKKNKREAYLEVSEYRGGRSFRAREPAQGTKLNWAPRPTSRGNKNKVPPVCRYAMRLAEPQYGWQSRNAIDDAAVRLALFLAAATNLTNQNQPTSTSRGKLKFRQCVTNNVSCHSN